MDVVQETKLFIATYGARPSKSTALGKSIRQSSKEQQAAVQELVEGCATLHKQSIAKADRLITAVKKGVSGTKAMGMQLALPREVA